MKFLKESVVMALTVFLLFAGNIATASPGAGFAQFNILPSVNKDDGSLSLRAIPQIALLQLTSMVDLDKIPVLYEPDILPKKRLLYIGANQIVIATDNYKLE